MTAALRSRPRGVLDASFPATIDVEPAASIVARLHRDPFNALSAGRFLYLIARAINARTIVDCGCGAGLSTLYLAAAVHDNFGGRVIGTEADAALHSGAVAHLAAAGLEQFVDLRCGSALQSLVEPLPDRIDLLWISGPEDNRGAVLGLLRSRLRPGAVVMAEPVRSAGGDGGAFVAELRCGTAGFQSATLPYPRGLEFAVVA
jgi:predicted O-methyltransferase YrrM